MSPEADVAFPVALRLASMVSPCHLFVTHVLPSPYKFYAEIVEPGLAAGLNPEIAKVAEDALRSRYESMMDRCCSSSFHVLIGVEGVELVRFARKYNVDVVVMSLSVAEARMRGADLTLRSFLAKRCPCPLLMVQPSRRPARKSRTEGDPARKVLDLGEYRRRSRRRPSGQGA